MILPLRAAGRGEKFDAGHRCQVAVPALPDALELGLRARGHLEAVHGDEHAASLRLVRHGTEEEDRDKTPMYVAQWPEGY